MPDRAAEIMEQIEEGYRQAEQRQREKDRMDALIKRLRDQGDTCEAYSLMQKRYAKFGWK
jgi:hypothetical protein